MHKFKNMMLPLSMIAGALFYQWMHYLTFLSPYLIYLMLTVTYTRIDNPSELKMTRMHWTMLATQMVLAALIYAIIAPFNQTIAAGVFICVFIPTATAAPVITAMLGGNITKVASYSLLCNVFVAITGPAVLAAIGEHPEITFLESFKIICSRVFPLLILPIITAFTLHKCWRKMFDRIAKQQIVSFYLWVLALFIVVGNSVAFAIKNFSPDKMWTMAALAIGALIVCLLQFYIGHRLGDKFNERITVGQSLGQKNTVLAIWLALTYMNPIASIAPAAYVAWQNIVNSTELIKHNHHAS
jgi:BASS family bile acid:Na+ symporter